MSIDLGALGIDPPGPGADPDDPAVSLWFLVTMAERTARASPAAVDPALVARLEEITSERPGRDEQLGQLHIDAASCLRRARAILDAVGAEDAPLIAIGDDDAVTIALGLLGASDVHAVDLDERLLFFLEARGVSTTRADVLHGEVPQPLRRRFAAAVTDPFRDLDGGLGFLSFAAACVRDGGDLFWVDHPDWNFEHAEVRETLRALGWDVVESHEDLHAYPLPPGAFEDVARAYPDHAGSIEALARRTLAWSSLYRLRRRG